MLKRLLLAALILGIVVGSQAVVAKTITFVSHFDDEPVVRAFEEKYGVDIEYTQMGWSDMKEKLVIWAATDTMPDVIRVSVSWWQPPSWKPEDSPYMDLLPFLARDGISTDEFVPFVLERASVNGKMYGMPYVGWAGVPTTTMKINTEMYQLAGLALPDWDWTWNDYVRNSKALTVDFGGDGEPDQWGSGSSRWWINTLYYTVWSFGGKFFTDDGSAPVLLDYRNEINEALTFLRDLQDVYHVEPWYPDQLPVAQSVGWSHHMGISIHKDALSGIETIMHPMPKGPNGRVLREVAGGLMDPLVMSKKTGDPDLAWELIKFISIDPDGTTAYIKAESDPPPLATYRPNLDVMDAYLPDTMRQWFKVGQRITMDMIDEEPWDSVPIDIWTAWNNVWAPYYGVYDVFSGESPMTIIERWNTELTNHFLDRQQ